MIIKQLQEFMHSVMSSQTARKQGSQAGRKSASQQARQQASEHDKESCKNASKQSSRGERKEGVSQGGPRGIPGGPREVPGWSQGSAGGLRECPIPGGGGRREVGRGPKGGKRERP